MQYYVDRASDMSLRGRGMDIPGVGAVLGPKLLQWCCLVWVSLSSCSVERVPNPVAEAVRKTSQSSNSSPSDPLP